MTDQKKPRGRSKTRTCLSCGVVEKVLASNTSPRCYSCGRQRASALKSQKARVERTCGYCRSTFTVAQSVLSGRTNSSANYCCRPCYSAFLRGTGKRRNNGAVWKRQADAVRSANPFCAWCGTMSGLQVHHIVPNRLTHDDHPENLIPLCTKHHRWIETITVGIERAGEPERAPTAFLALATTLRHRQDKTRQILEHLACR